MSSKPQPDSSKSSSTDKSSKGNSKSNSEPARRQSLPFEPTKSRKPAEKPSTSTPAKSASVPTSNANVRAAATAKRPAAKVVSQTNRSTAQEAAIPDAVSQRMIKRMAVLCGVPTVFGMSTFIVSYLLRINNLFEVPTYAVLLVSLGWFGLGVLGLSYGVLSASWDEEMVGSLAGWSEFKTNWGRMMAARRSSKEQFKD